MWWPEWLLQFPYTGLKILGKSSPPILKYSTCCQLPKSNNCNNWIVVRIYLPHVKHELKIFLFSTGWICMPLPTPESTQWDQVLRSIPVSGRAKMDSLLLSGTSAQSTGPVAACIEGKPIINSAFFCCFSFHSRAGPWEEGTVPGNRAKLLSPVVKCCQWTPENVKTSETWNKDLNGYTSFHQFGKKTPTNLWFYFNSYLLGLKQQQTNKGGGG